MNQKGHHDTKKSSGLLFFLNGRKVQERRVNTQMNLATYIRDVAGLTGTKVACGQGGCGACTVMLSRWNPLTKDITHSCVYACLLPICYVHGMAVTTVEGVGSTKDRLHPVQDYIVRNHGIQCGFCTPGMVMTMYTLLRNIPKPTQEEIESALQGVICRCTGYMSILQGFENLCNKGDGCCRIIKNTSVGEVKGKNTPGFDSILSVKDPTQELIFPPELMITEAYQNEEVVFTDDYMKWLRPTTLEQLKTMIKEYPMATFVAGCNAMELNQMSITEDGVAIGAVVSFSEVINFIKKLTLPDVYFSTEEKTRIFKSLVNTLYAVGGIHTQNTSTFGGHIATAGGTSDIMPLLIASGSMVTILNANGQDRHVSIEYFMNGINRCTLEPGDIITSVFIPISSAEHFIQGYPTDIDCVVNAAMCVRLQDKTNFVKELKLCFGGISRRTIVLNEITSAFIGRLWDESLCEDIDNKLDKYGTDELSTETAFKLAMMKGLFFKFYHTVCANADIEGISISTDQLQLQKEVTTRLHTWQDHVVGYVGKPIQNVSAQQHSTGESVYLDDIPPRRDELFLTLVTSTRAHAKLRSVDTDRALSVNGVVGFVSAKDVPGSNFMGIATQDEEIFATTKVSCVGQVIGGILAETKEASKLAAQLVHVDYEDLKPILTIEEAIDANMFYQPVLDLDRGNVDEAFVNSDEIQEGEVKLGGQQHFYMETQRSLVIPEGGDGKMDVISSTQNPSLIQFTVARTLGISSNRIKTRVTRLGGGFGGKESRSLIPAIACAVAANMMRKPVRCVLERQMDMTITGGRHPIVAKYKVGYKKDGSIMGLAVTIYTNAGSSEDLSIAVLFCIVTAIWHVYCIPAICIRGYACKTNLPSNTAFRGFGKPQAMFIMETIISKIASRCGVPEHQVREMNFLRKDVDQPIDDGLEIDKLILCWEGGVGSNGGSDGNGGGDDDNVDVAVDAAAAAADDDDDDNVDDEGGVGSNGGSDVDYTFRCSRWKKKGISIIPTKFPIGLPEAKFLNQAGALVNVYTDGSVSVNHGGVEMGQGLHTKIIQIASTVLGVPMDRVYISETSTQIVPNTTATSASCSTDYNGMAVKRACEEIVRRLQPFMDENPNGSWEDWVSSAYKNLTSLSATGYYGAEKLSLDTKTLQGRAVLYCTYGAACSEVEIDCLTGEHRVLRTDIVMDVGRSINQAIDIGQIEGAFLQGYGLFMTEEMRWSDKGQLLTCGPVSYNVPRIRHIPRAFNVNLLPNSENPEMMVFSSKGIGEPPLFLSASVFFAVNEAIRAARAEIGLEEDFNLSSPATQKNIRIACGDQLKYCHGAK
ncbi:xanthine dehydrogenase/oxidase-like [Glandiceps talaboti]